MRSNSGIEKTESNCQIEKIGIIGTGIAMIAVQAGLDVVLKSRSLESLNEALKRMNQYFGKVATPERATEFISRIKTTTCFSDLASADIIIECIIEDKESKLKLFKELDSACPNNVILATNTSSLSINNLALSVSKPERFVGIHFFNPVHKMQLVEIIRSKYTSDRTLNKVTFFVNKLGKMAIVIHDSPGFIVNRLLFGFLNEALDMLEEKVASVKDIDLAIKLGLNYPMGPFELMDLIGLDVCLSIMANLYETTGNPKFKPPDILREMVKDGKLGRKTNEGFYRY